MYNNLNMKIFMETKVEKESIPVFKNDLVEIVYTSKSSFHKNGDKDVIHRLQAEKLVKKGVAKLAK